MWIRNGDQMESCISCAHLSEDGQPPATRAVPCEVSQPTAVAWLERTCVRVPLSGQVQMTVIFFCCLFICSFDTRIFFKGTTFNPVTGLGQRVVGNKNDPHCLKCRDKKVPREEAPELGMSSVWSTMTQCLILFARRWSGSASLERSKCERRPSAQGTSWRGGCCR